MTIKRLALLKTTLLSAMLLGICGFAVDSLGSTHGLFAPERAAATLDAVDDPVRGWQILESRPPTRPQQVSKAQGASAVLLLDDWTFTGKTKPSPYH